jgi:peptidoglycan/xylan/chitin deacetylase (PgdA/CDA1 family)
MPTTVAPTTAVTVAPPTTTTTWPTGPAQRITRGDPGRRRVAFSFDAGSDAGHAREILDVLDRHGITASFGLCGTWARANPQLVRDIATGGHHVINHTDEHRSFTGYSTGTPPLPAGERREALERADATLAPLLGHSTRPWFRPPYGDTDASVDADVGAIGYRYDVLWTVDSLGWTGLSAADVVARCLERAGNGAIYLFHVGAASSDAEALPAIVAGLRAQGYEIGPVPFVL